MSNLYKASTFLILSTFLFSIASFAQSDSEVDSLEIVEANQLIDQQVEAFNAANLDAFSTCFSEDVLVQRFPRDTMSIGRDALKKGYLEYFTKQKNTQVEVLQRIVIGNKVIDEEQVKENGKTYRQVAIYTLEQGEITVMTFIHFKMKMENAEALVEAQLVAYNNRDIEKFVSVFAEDIQGQRFSNEVLYQSRKELRGMMQAWFERAPDLHCDIKTRMLLGNVVIDEEHISANGKAFTAVAIYEVNETQIQRVTFLQ